MASIVRAFSSSASRIKEVPVAIVGAGPTGLVLSTLLSAFGEWRAAAVLPGLSRSTHNHHTIA